MFSTLWPYKQYYIGDKAQSFLVWKNSLLIGTSTGITFQWNDPEQLHRTFRGHHFGISSLIEYQDILWMASQDTRITLWDIHTGNLLNVISTHSDVTSMVIWKDHIVSAGGGICHDNPPISVWNNDGENVCQWEVDVPTGK